MTSSTNEASRPVFKCSGFFFFFLSLRCVWKCENSSLRQMFDASMMAICVLYTVCVFVSFGRDNLFVLDIITLYAVLRD